MAVDKNGFLWIGTTDGLNTYDGYSIVNYFKEEEKALASNTVEQLICDSNNNIWCATPTGVTRIDGRRTFHRIALQDTITDFSCINILETKKYGIVLFTNLGQYYFDNALNKWNLLTWIPNRFRFDKIQEVSAFTTDKIIFSMDSLVGILDYASQKIIYEDYFYPALSTCRVNENQIAVGLQTGQVRVIDIHTRKTLHEYWPTATLNGITINTALNHVQCAPNGDLLLATTAAGLVRIDKKGNSINYIHDPLQEGSISAKNVYKILTASNGNVFVATGIAGLNIFNIYNKQAGYTSIFSDKSGSLFDNYLNDLAEDKDGNLWLAAYDRLIKWDRKKNESEYYFYYHDAPLRGLRTLTIRALCFDKLDRLWLSALDGGLAYYDKNRNKIVPIPTGTPKGIALTSQYIRSLLAASDGNIWVCTNTGMYFFNPLTFKITILENDPVLKEISKKRVIALFEDSRNNIWIDTDEGVYRYGIKNKLIKKFSISDGLLANVCFGFREDRNGNIYMGSQYGFNIISKEDKIYAFSKKNGLRYDRCESFLQDDAGNMWIANSKCLIKFDPVSHKMQFFDVNSGISPYGFRVNSCVKTKSGEMYFGGPRGISYFFPEQLINNPAPVLVSIYKIALKDSSIQIDNNYSLSIADSREGLQFYFSAINLLGSKNIIYEYKLEGYDREWQTGIDIRQARYALLPPGEYTFKVRAGTDRINWIDAGNNVLLTIIPPVWQRWWFITAVIALITGIIYQVIAARDKKIAEQKEEIETEQAINYFASSMYEQQHVENILWDVAKNCIGRLSFEDCVVYLMDNERKALIQTAAYGPKSPKQFEITQPLEIAVGKGIVGNVAKSGKAEIINDTTKDPRYIVDDERRYSEISVPIMSGNEVLGVIDCEHSKKNFFTQKHLSILTTIASLCANKIIRARAEQEKMRAQMVLNDTQQKMTEIEMQALRAQMNPHFIFNCLNSINRYIVKSDQVTASFYLTRFAKLIRLILDNSNSRNVILTNEIEALKLYIEMEALRFDKKFSYAVSVDKNISTDNMEVPPLIIQPFVENAIWHGLLHKESDGQLNIAVTMIKGSVLQCVIEDNGVGRKKSQELKSKSATSRKSLGMKLTEHRLTLLNKHTALNASVEIIDLYDEKEAPAGTRVVLKIPV